MPIRLLDSEVVSRIAAGEVVERPASVVKELVENSLDAGASQVAVEIRNGGVTLIRVSDNGAGIPAGEVGLLFRRHATSKVTSVQDLDSIATLGFRGEALASIAAVAEVEVLTCATGETAGTLVTVKDGAVTSPGSQSRAQGTTVSVHNLFRNVPARLKFLKSTATESGHVADIVSRYALAFPEVRFTLTVDGRPSLRTPGSGRLIDSIIEVYGTEIARNMLEVGPGSDDWDGGSPSVQVTGMAGAPAVSRANRNAMSVFVNRRWVNSRLITWALDEAYHGLLMTGKHPVAIINISLPPTEVDVNVHPAKTEVKFHKERLVFGSVQKAVRRALLETSVAPGIEEAPPAYAAPPMAVMPSSAPPGIEAIITAPAPMARQVPAFNFPVLRLLGQIARSYIVAEGPDGLYLIDQHAAHERILFEQVQSERAGRGVEVQGLLEPVTLEVSPGQQEVLKARYEKLADFGFLIEPFGARTYLVRTVPALLHNKDWMAVLRELLDEPAADNRTEWSERVAASISCHSAVRAGQALSDDEMRGLIRQLEQVANPNTCPHGRPTLIHLSSKQMEKHFGRE